MSRECSAYVPGGLCSNGFPQNAGCRPKRCDRCGQWTATVPLCQREDIGPAWVDDTGFPIFMQEARDAG